MAERNLTSLGTNINSPATQLMVMMSTAVKLVPGLQVNHRGGDARGGQRAGHKWTRLFRQWEGGRKGGREMIELLKMGETGRRRRMYAGEEEEDG